MFATARMCFCSWDRWWSSCCTTSYCLSCTASNDLSSRLGRTHRHTFETAEVACIALDERPSTDGLQRQAPLRPVGTSINIRRRSLSQRSAATPHLARSNLSTYGPNEPRSNSRKTNRSAGPAMRRTICRMGASDIDIDRMRGPDMYPTVRPSAADSDSSNLVKMVDGHLPKGDFHLQARTAARCFKGPTK